MKSLCELGGLCVMILRGPSCLRVFVARIPRAFEAKKKSPVFWTRLSVIKDRQRLTLPGVIPVPSALTGLTSLFGMGRGDPRRYSHLKILAVCCWPLAFGEYRLRFGYAVETG